METISCQPPQNGAASEILIAPGLLRRRLEIVRERLPARRIVQVIDDNVAGILDADAENAPDAPVVRLRAGESEKSLSRYAALCEEILALRPDRKTVIVAVGGGITGDMAGFAAATLLRGLRLVQVPTTLLAQVDSSVGGKTGVNAAAGKNLVGAFHQPALVLADPGALATLPRREWLTGYAEVVKYALLGDAEFFAQLERRPPAPEDAAARPDALAAVIAHCCRMKAGIVAEDEREAGARALLNYGHTFAHALEALAGYDGSATHGEAVAAGMMLAAGFAARRGVCDPEVAEAMRGHWQRAGLPARIADLGAGGAGLDWPRLLAGRRLEDALLQDKKAGGAALTLILPVRIGKCEIFPQVDASEVADFMRRHWEGV